MGSSSPSFGVKINKYLSCHHPVILDSNSTTRDYGFCWASTLSLGTSLPASGWRWPLDPLSETSGFANGINLGFLKFCYHNLCLEETNHTLYISMLNMKKKNTWVGDLCGVQIKIQPETCTHTHKPIKHPCFKKMWQIQTITESRSKIRSPTESPSTPPSCGFPDQ